MTVDERVQAFINEWNGKPGVGDTDANKGQCVGLIEVWDDELGEPHVWGNAKDLLANADRGAYTVTANTPTNFPQAGDVLCYNGNWGGGVGHTVLVISADVNGFTSFEQNNPTGSAPRIVHHVGYTDVEGWMRAKVLDNLIAQGDEPMIGDTSNEFGRWNKAFYQIRGRNASHDEFVAAAVGQTWLHALEILSDDPEADAATHAQEVGTVAVRDNWQEQITTLQGQVTAQGVTIDSLQKQLAAEPPATPGTVVTPDPTPAPTTPPDAPGPVATPEPAPIPDPAIPTPPAASQPALVDVIINKVWRALLALIGVQ